jgi:D-alanyl-lipoteichoic acid acyltransferase DltB (MBOAT superfamily)
MTVGRVHGRGIEHNDIAIEREADRQLGCGIDNLAQYRRYAYYVPCISKGPIVRHSKRVELLLPQTVRARADKVIE